MSSSLRIIVSGLIAQYPLGGVTWDYFQYVRRLKNYLCNPRLEINSRMSWRVGS